MRWQILWTVFCRELRETLRDRRTLWMMVGLPILMYPLLIIAISKLQDSREAASESRAPAVAVWGDAPQDLLSALRQKGFVIKAGEGLKPEVASRLAAGVYAPFPPSEPKARSRKKRVQEISHPLADAARPVVLRRKADTVLVVWPDLNAGLRDGGLGHVAVLYDSVRPDSETASQRLSEVLSAYRKEVVEKREKERGLSPGFARAVDVTSANVATITRRAGMGLGQFLSFLLIMASFTGAFYSSIETTAGEKERGTMQTLLCAPLTSNEIIGGKFLAVWTVALGAALANILSMGATFARLASEVGGVSISPATLALAMLLLVPVTLMMTAIFIAVGAFANDFKDGQNFLTPVLMLIMLPCSAAMLPGVELNIATSFVPVLNISLLIKGLFINEASPDMVFLTMVSSAIYAVMALLLAARVFERETVLLGGKDTIRGILGIGRQASERPSPAISLVIFAITLVAAFYGSLGLRDQPTSVMLLTMEYGCLLAPVLAALVILRFSWRNTLLLYAPSLRAVAAAVLLGGTSWVIAGSLSFRLMPPPEELSRALSKLMLMGEKPMPLWVLWFCVAITPALCEELLFRGFVLSGLRRLGAPAAISVSALLFGLAHASIYRLLPTFIIGLILGFAAWKTRSIATGMLIHAINNGFLVTLVAKPSLVKTLGLGSDFNPSWQLIFGAVCAFALGLWLLVLEPKSGYANGPASPGKVPAQLGSARA